MLLDIPRVLQQFPELTHIKSIFLETGYVPYGRTITSSKIVYVCESIKTKELLKVGLSTNWVNRMHYYAYKDRSVRPIMVHLFDTISWDEQDRLEIALREFLIEDGHRLPWDNTNQRLTKV